MGKVKDEKLFLLIKNFLLVYLPVQRNASELTIKTYRATINQYLKFLADRNKTVVLSVTFEMISMASVNAFLDYLSVDKQATPATRNNKLDAIRAFVSYASACQPEYISLSGELSEIKVQKNDPFAKVDYMTEEAVTAMFQAPDTNTLLGIRDQFLMIFMYDTGARIQEVLNVKLKDLRIGKTPTVKLFGKGRKTRVVPLMKDTVSHLQNYLRVCLAAHLPDLLYGVDDDKLGVRVLPHEVLQLFVQSVADFPGSGGEVEISGIVHAIHHKHPALDALKIIFQRKVEYRSLMDLVAPQILPGADMVSDLGHQERLADFRCSDKDVRSCIEQVLNHSGLGLEHVVHQLVQGHSMEVGWVTHPTHLPVKCLQILFGGIAFSVRVWYSSLGILRD